MKRIILLMTAAAAIAARGDTRAYYSLGVPGAPVICNTTNVADNAWLASNNVAVVSASFSFDGVAVGTGRVPASAFVFSIKSPFSSYQEISQTASAQCATSVMAFVTGLEKS